MTPLPERPEYDRLGDESRRVAGAVEADRAPVALAASGPARIAALRGLGPDRAAAYMAGLQRGAGNAAVARMLAAARPQTGTLARKFGLSGDTYPLPGVGSGKYNMMHYGWSADWTETGRPGDTQTIVKSDESFAGNLKVKAGTRGTLRLRMMAHFLVDLGSSSQQFNLLSECSWTVEVSRHGKVETANPLPPSWSLPLRKPSYTSTEDPYVVQGPPAVAAIGHSFSLTPVFQIRQKGSETTDVGGNLNVDFGSKGVGIPTPSIGITTPSKDKTKTVNPPAGSFSGRPLTIKLEPYDMAKIEVAAKPEVKRASHKVRFHHEANTNVSADERQKVMDWYTSLSALTRKRLKAGTLKIQVDAYASNTGTAPKNQHTYAQGRADAVKSILGRFLGADAWDVTAWGEDKEPDSDPPDKKPGESLKKPRPPEERPAHERADPSRVVVDLTVWEEVTAGAQEDNELDRLPRE